MNFTEKQIEKLIAYYEQQLVTNMNDMVAKEVIVKEKKSILDDFTLEYEIADSDFEASKKLYQENSSLLDQLVKTRNGSEKDVRLLRTTSHLDKPPKTRNHISWQPEIKEILFLAQRLMTFDEIFSTVESRGIIKNPSKKKFIDAVDKTKIRDLKGLKYYKGRLGLKEWFIDQTPKAEFIKEFMYSNN